MNQIRNISKNEDGFVLVVALMVMIILSLIGIAGLNTSMFEQQIAGNDWNAKRSFYKADGGISLGTEVIEQSFTCTDGFYDGVGTHMLSNSKVVVTARTSNKIMIWSNAIMDSATITDKLNDSANQYDVAYPSDVNGILPGVDVGYLYIGGQTSVLPGGALEMAAGYEGKGKSSAQGGTAKIFDIYSQFLGLRNSESIILASWRHLIGNEGTSCIYK